MTYEKNALKEADNCRNNAATAACTSRVAPAPICHRLFKNICDHIALKEAVGDLRQV